MTWLFLVKVIADQAGFINLSAAFCYRAGLTPLFGQTMAAIPDLTAGKEPIQLLNARR
tara:strand:+ start:2293 stop:2466 length:174 start_codon:yes stop_codon:yes gene_type:complete